MSAACLALAVQLSLACSTTLDPTVLVTEAGAGGAGDEQQPASGCAQLTLSRQIFLACSEPASTFSDAARDCQRRGGELARIATAEENEALVAQARELGTETNLWIGGSRDDDHVWSFADGSVFWSGLADGAAPTGVFVNWQGGEPNDDSTVTNEPERCAAVALFDGGWRDRACSLQLSYFCELPRDPP